MTAPQSAPTPGAVASWPPGMPRSLDYPRAPVGSILRAAVRRWGDRTAYLDHDVALTYTELGRTGARRRRVARRPRRSVGATSSRCTSPTAASTRRSTTGSCWPGRPSPPPTRCCPAPELAAQLTDAGATRARHLGPGAALRARRPRADPGATVVVTGEAHILDFAARLDGLEPTATSTSPTCSAPTPPTGASTPTSTPRPTSRTSPTPAGRPASARASSCRTRTSSPTCCSRPAGPAAPCRRWTRPAT